MPDTIAVTRLLTEKGNVGSTRVEHIDMRRELHAGEALLTVESFALTTNNITYAAFGDAMQYWSFFPTGQDGWGMMPVWGFATVRASSVPELTVGERFYGYLPMAGVLRIRPGRFSERGFYDLSPHRTGLPSPYNQYTRCATDPAHVPELEDYQMLLRPLFFTSFMLADFLDDNGFFGAAQVVVSSASSKTAYGTAFCLRSLPRRPRLIGLTSASNRQYVEGLGLYDGVLAYEELTTLPASVPTLYLDFSGSEALRQAVHAHVSDRLVHDCYAGSASSTAYLTDAGRYHPPPQPFFAPTQIHKRNVDWGAAVLAQRFAEAQGRFLRAVSDPVDGFMRLQRGHGFEDAARIIGTLHGTGGRPECGYTISLDSHSSA